MVRFTKKRDSLSILITMSVILILFLSATASAVRMNLKLDKSVYNVNEDSITFTASVDIQAKERVPISSLSLVITKDDEIVKTCDFSVDGTSSCPNIDITRLNSGNETQGDLNGKGYGIGDPDDPDTESTDFGFGYGFEYEKRKTSYNGELSYEVSWDLTSETLEEGKYKAELQANAYNEGEEYTYITTRLKSFNIKDDIKNEKTKVTATVKIKGNDGINYINELTTFSKQTSKFNANLRKTLDGTDIGIDGTTSLKLYGESDKTKVWITITTRSDQYNYIEFNKDKIELTTEAKVRFKQTSPGVSTESYRDELDEIYILIEDGDVLIRSLDPKLDFEVQMDIDTFKYN